MPEKELVARAMNHTLLFIAGLLIAALAALFAVPYFVDWNSYRGVFEEEASRVLGREVRVGGSVNVRFLPVPYARFEKIRIADLKGGTGEPFFRADGLTLWLAVPPLLRGVLEANEVRVAKPELRLAVDEQGNGNWGEAALSPGALPFVPAGVTLQSVSVEDGAMFLAGPGRRQLMRLDKITGELNADSLNGPFRFKGTMIHEGAEREVRFATAPTEADGAVRMKASVRTLASGTTYTLDGRFADLGGKPRVEGDLGARFSVGSSAPAPKGAKKAEDGNGEMKARLVANLLGARLSDIQIALDNLGQPQLVAGSAEASWSTQNKLAFALNSKLIDLDRVMGAGPDPAAPLLSARTMLSALAAQLPPTADIDGLVQIDHASLGGEAMSAVRFEIARQKGPLQIRALKADLPGGARVDLAGTVFNDEKATGFSGTLALRGASLNRFVSWGLARPAFAEGRTDGGFVLGGDFKLADNLVELTGGAVEFNGMALKGAARLVTLPPTPAPPGRQATGATPQAGTGTGPATGRPLVEIDVEGPRLDTALLFPGGIGLAVAAPPSAVDAKSKVAEPSAGSGPPVYALAATDLDKRIRLRVGELKTGTRVLRDVDADVGVENGGLWIPRLRFVSAEGLEADIEGTLAIAGDVTKGALKGRIAANTAGALAELVELAGLPAESRLATLVPLQAAGTVDLGQRQPSAVDIAFNGTHQSGNIAARLLLDGGRNGWRGAPADISVTADGENLGPVLSALFAQASSGAVRRAQKVRKGTLRVEARGKATDGMAALAVLDTQGLSLGYSGKARLPEGSGLALDGEIMLQSEDAADVMQVAGLDAPGGLAGMPVGGRLDVVTADQTTALKPRALAIGGTAVSGAIELKRAAGKPLAVNGQLRADEARVAGLLSAVLVRPAGKTGAQAVAASDSGSGTQVWPDQLFELSLSDQVNGRIGVDFGRLVLEDGLGLSSACTEFEFFPGGIGLKILSARAIGGDVTGEAKLAKVPGGAELSATVGLKDGRMERLAGERMRARASGHVSLAASASGRGGSPAAALIALRGKGTLETGKGGLKGFNPAQLSQATDQIIAGKDEITPDAIRAVVETALPTGESAFGPQKLGFEIVDGAVRLQQLSIATADGRTTLRSTLDLMQLAIDNDWRIETAPKAGATGASARPALPPVGVVYSGRLSEFARLEPRLDTGALEREMQVRRMERDVEELERLRKIDEERARAEEERQKALEAARARLKADEAAAGQTAGQGSMPAPQSGAPGAVPSAPASGSPAGSSGPNPVGATGALPGAQEGSQPPVPRPSPPPRAGLSQTAPVAPRPQPKRLSPSEEILRSLGN